MSWFNIVRLGFPGCELDITSQVIDINVDEMNIQLEQRNLSGAMRRSYLRQNVPTVTLSLARLPDDLMAVIRGFQASLAPLNFIFNSSLAVKFLAATSSAADTIVIPPSSASGIEITGVFLQSDCFETGTNYYTGAGSSGYGEGGYGDGGFGGGGGTSSFDPATGIITLGITLPDANTDVYINYTFTGINCWAKVTARPHQGVYKNFWQATLTLTGA